jgi:hypothetical protein
MRKLNIAIGSSRRAVKWQNTQISWQQLLMKLEKPTITKETIECYVAMTKSEQDNIKDVGGFVGGFCKNESRSKSSISSRDLLCWDFDNCTTEIYKKLAKLDEMKVTYVIHSTHKHTPTKPRLRVIIPLEVTLSSKHGEYEFAIEKMTEKLDLMDMVDRISFERNRLVYWPSISSNAEYYFKSGEGEYLNWLPYLEGFEGDGQENKNPGQTKTNKGQNKDKTKKRWYKKDPRLVTGVIGAFNRTYPISKCIAEFLSDVYSGPDERGRYTFIAGTGASGVEVKDDDTLCQSYHSTDPARCYKGSEKPRECNSFDLIMIHKYDDDQDKLKKAIKWALELDDIHEDEKFKKEQEYNFYRGVAWDIEQIQMMGKEGQKISYPLLSESNLAILLDHLGVKIAYNEMMQRKFIDGVKWEDDDYSVMKDRCQAYKFKSMSRPDLLSHLNILAKKNSYHPIKAYLESLKWDGVARVETLLSTYFDAVDNEYTRGIMRKVLAGAVKRVYEPGCEMQYMLVLSGTSDIGKSSFWRRLAGEEWFSDDMQLTDMGPRTGTEKIQNKWIVELPELSGMKKADMEAVKAFLTRQEDVCRLAYGRETSNLARQSIMVGTTNEDGFLKDLTGNKRFLPVKVTRRLKDDLDRDQIWAEVMTFWENEDIRLSQKLRYMAEQAANEAMEVDDKFALVVKFLETKIPLNVWQDMKIWERQEFIKNADDKEKNTFLSKDLFLREKVAPLEIWCECFGRTKDSIKRADSNEITACLIKLNWTKKMSARDREYGPLNSRKKPDMI